MGLLGRPFGGGGAAPSAGCSERFGGPQKAAAGAGGGGGGGGVPPAAQAPPPGTAATAAAYFGGEGARRLLEARCCGSLEVGLVRGASTAVETFSTYPVRLMFPGSLARGTDVVWCHALSYGGGLCAGDQVSLRVALGAGATLALSTVGANKAFKSSAGSEPTFQGLDASVGPGALLAVLPQHTSCFRGALYVQHQLFDVAVGGNVVYVDWLSAGRRHGRGENWDFESFESRALFKLGGEPVLLEGQRLFASPGLPVERQLQGYGATAVVVLLGSHLAEAIAGLEAVVLPAVQKQFPRSQHQRQMFSEGARGGGSPEDDSLDARRGKLLLSMSPLEDADGRKVGAVLRAVGDTVERVKRCLCKIVEPLEAKIGSNPYAAV